MVNSVSVENLTVRFDTVTALSDVTHTFRPGTTTAVMGVNGAGKTVMLECLAGLLKPTAGTICCPPQRLAYVSQHLPRNWMPITAGEVMAMGRYGRHGRHGRVRMFRRMGARDRAAVHDAGELLAVAQLKDCCFSTLSGGQQQRVRIAQVLAGEPELIMLDEPVTGLDIPSQERILEVIKQYAERGAVVIITSHHLNEARHCDSVVLLANRLVASGASGEVLTPDRLRATFGERLLDDHTADGNGQEVMLLDDHGCDRHNDHDPYGHHGRPVRRHDTALSHASD